MGTFCHVTLTSMLGTQLERPVLSQSDTTYRGRPLAACPLWPMYFSHFWPKTTLQLLLDGQDDKQIYIIFFLICKSNKTTKKKLKSWTFTKWVGGQRINQETKLNNRRVVIDGGSLCFSFDSKFNCFVFSLPARLRNWDGRHLPPSSLPSCLKCGVTE